MNENESLDEDIDEDEEVEETTDIKVSKGDDLVDALSVSNSAAALADKEAERLRLQSDVEAFLARGGKIEEVPTSAIGDPPKKPVSSYGGQPI